MAKFDHLTCADLGLPDGALALATDHILCTFHEDEHALGSGCRLLDTDGTIVVSFTVVERLDPHHAIIEVETFIPGMDAITNRLRVWYVFTKEMGYDYTVIRDELTGRCRALDSVTLPMEE